MIYEPVPEDAPFEQGDLFRQLPKPEFSLQEVVTVSQPQAGQAEFRTSTWDRAAAEETPVRALVPVRQVSAILITQTCDAARAEALSFCEIAPFYEVVP